MLIHLRNFEEDMAAENKTPENLNALNLAIKKIDATSQQIENATTAREKNQAWLSHAYAQLDLAKANAALDPNNQALQQKVEESKAILNNFKSSFSKAFALLNELKTISDPINRAETQVQYGEAILAQAKAVHAINPNTETQNYIDQANIKLEQYNQLKPVKSQDELDINEKREPSQSIPNAEIKTEKVSKGFLDDDDDKLDRIEDAKEQLVETLNNIGKAQVPTQKRKAWIAHAEAQAELAEAKADYQPNQKNREKVINSKNNLERLQSADSNVVELNNKYRSGPRPQEVEKIKIFVSEFQVKLAEASLERALAMDAVYSNEDTKRIIENATSRVNQSRSSDKELKENFSHPSVNEPAAKEDKEDKDEKNVDFDTDSLSPKGDPYSDLAQEELDKKVSALEDEKEVNFDDEPSKKKKGKKSKGKGSSVEFSKNDLKLAERGLRKHKQGSVPNQNKPKIQKIDLNAMVHSEPGFDSFDPIGTSISPTQQVTDTIVKAIDSELGIAVNVKKEKTKKKIRNFLADPKNFAMSMVVASSAEPSKVIGGQNVRNRLRDEIEEAKRFTKDAQNKQVNVINDVKVNIGKKQSNLNTYEFIPEEIKAKEKSEQKYVVKFNGNAEFAATKILESKEEASRLGYVAIAFDYPGVATDDPKARNPKELVKAGIAQVDRLIAEGAKPENIILDGHSLGGAVATLVAAHYHSKKPPQTVNLVNGRSFSKLSTATEHLIKNQTGSAVLGKITGKAIKAIGLEMNAKKAYNRIPEENKSFYFAKNDEVIPFAASLAKAVTPKLDRAEMEKAKGLDVNHGDNIHDKVTQNGQTGESLRNNAIKFFMLGKKAKDDFSALLDSSLLIDDDFSMKVVEKPTLLAFKNLTLDPETPEQKLAREHIIKPAVSLDRNQEFIHAKSLLDKALKEDPNLKSFKISKAKKDERGKVIAGEAELAHSFICQKNKNGEFELFRVLDFLGKGTEGKVKNIENEKGEIFVVKIAAASDKDKDEMKVLEEAGILIGNFQRQRDTKFDKTLQQEIGTKQYTVMEKVPGDKLNEFIKKNNPTEEQKIKILMAILTDTKFIHENLSVIHRDIKPDNMLISHDENGDPKCKIIDFGTFKRAKNNEKITSSYSGSPQYMAPELGRDEFQEKYKAALETSKEIAQLQKIQVLRPVQELQLDALKAKYELQKQAYIDVLNKRNDTYDNKVDIFSIGVIATDVLKLDLKKLGLQGLKATDPDERLSADQALKIMHPKKENKSENNSKSQERNAISVGEIPPITLTKDFHDHQQPRLNRSASLSELGKKDENKPTRPRSNST